MGSARAVRYRRLALATKDRTDASLLLKLADESERGILCTSEWLSARPSHQDLQPLKAENAEARFDWDPLNDRR
jgi:hypothetical protein